MRRIIQFVMFMSMLFIALLAVNYFIFFTMGTLLDLSSITVYSLILLFAISYPTSAVLEKTVSHILTRAFYTISSTWMGISVFVVFLILGYEILNLVFNIPSFAAGIGIIIAASFISVYAILNSLYFEIKEIKVNMPNLKNEMRIVQLSDIHIGSVRNSGFMRKIVEKTNELNPDIVLITGDTVDGSAKLHPHMFNAIDGLKAPSFLIIGNHEIYEGLEDVLDVLSATKTNILRDDLIEINGIQIIGIDYSFDKGHLKNVLRRLEIDGSKPSILMYHVPTEIETVNKAGINLQLSGHTHKGQLFPFNFLGKLFFPYFSGLYNYNGTSLYVSQGTGTWGPPMRLGSKNEITMIHLKKA